MKEKNTEIHPLEPFLPPHATVLMLGSFPPKKEKWSMDFYYPNFINDMWRIYGWVFFGDKEHFLSPGKKTFDPDKIKAFLWEKGIALTDSGKEVVRLKDNASDKFLEIVETIDLADVLGRIPLCRTVLAAGQKATEAFLSMAPVKMPATGGCTAFTFIGREMRLYRLPSSSRAYPKSIEAKGEVYRKVFEEIGITSGDGLKNGPFCPEKEKGA